MLFSAVGPLCIPETVRNEIQAKAERLRYPRDLGETMVIAHAVTMAETGMDITVLIDEGMGTNLAGGEQARLLRMRERGESVGTLSIIGTVTVLERCVRDGRVEDKGEIRKIYAQFRGLDDGLPPIETTRLLSRELWSQRKVS